MDTLAENGYFEKPDIKSLENVVEYGIGLHAGTVFVDLWDIDNFSSCDKCLSFRKERLNKMNMNQIIYPRVICACTE